MLVDCIQRQGQSCMKRPKSPHTDNHISKKFDELSVASNLNVDDSFLSIDQLNVQDPVIDPVIDQSIDQLSDVRKNLKVIA